MSERAMFATMVAKPGKREQLKAVFESMFEQAAKEQGTMLYTLIEGDDAHTLLMYEQYRDQSAMDEHMASDALKDFHGQLSELLESGSAVTGTVVRKLR